MAQHDAEGVSPGGDVLNKLIPDDQPCLILMDELMNYISRNRKSGLADQFYNFLQNLTETVRGKKRCVLAVSIPASEMEMNAQDQQDYNRITKLLDRLGKAMVMSAEAETSEIIRRRLFDWEPGMVGANGKVMLDKEAVKTCREYAQWCVDHRQQIPGWFSVDEAQQCFQDTYPFHPSVLSVFERKWRGIPKFQQTRGILRLLALWVSEAYKQGYSGDHRDALITLGTAPLDNSTFRSAAFEQLGERNLETAITTDIAGGTNAHAVRLDQEATEEIDADSDQLNYDEFQVRQLKENIKRSIQDLKECVWRSYKHIFFLGKEGKLKHVDMGLITSSQTRGGPVDAMLGRLQSEGEIEKDISPRFLVRNWPGVYSEWSTKAVRDAFYSTPSYPRLLNPEAIKDTIARGVSQGMFAYVGKRGDGLYDPFCFEDPAFRVMDVEISDDVYLISREKAEAFRQEIAKTAASSENASTDASAVLESNENEPVPSKSTPTSNNQNGDNTEPVQTDFFRSLTWSGDVEPHKWMNFYTKVLSKYAQDSNLKLNVRFKAEPKAGITQEKMEETRAALRELGLDVDDLQSNS